LESFIRNNGNFSLDIINDKHFDIVIYAFNSRASEALIKAVIQHTHYKTYNYAFMTNEYSDPDRVYYYVPLYTAVQREYYEVADYLLKRKKADINYKSKYKDGDNIIKYLYKNFHINKKQMKFILKREFNVKRLSIELINNMIHEEDNNDLIKLLFKHFIFDNSFIIEMLIICREHIPKSDEELDKYIRDEKSKIKINKETYMNAMTSNNYDVILTLMNYDSDPKEVVIDRIHQLQIIEVCGENYMYSYEYEKYLLILFLWRS